MDNKILPVFLIKGIKNKNFVNKFLKNSIVLRAEIQNLLWSKKNEEKVALRMCSRHAAFYDRL